MAGLKNADHFAQGEKFNAGLLKWVLLMGGAGAAVLFFVIYLSTGGVAEGHTEPSAFHRGMAYSWLFAVMYFFSLTVGGIFWTLLHNASNSGWGIVIRRLMENLGSVVIVMFVLALPLLTPGFRDALWEWFPERAKVTAEAKEHAEHGLEQRRQELTESLKAAEVSYLTIEKENTAALAKATEGEKFYLQKELATAKAKFEAAKAALGSDEKLIEDLKVEHFKHANTILYKKSGYLNEGFWHFRFFFYGAALFGIIYTLRGWSVKGDETGDPKYFRRMRRAVCGFLPL
ncbi:MAG: hypothetical protein KDM64_11365, partial [Verrucomicrobiae bacterium]|nr:hypothetical protein [Verrucomicrobiae bacterium]